jgi:hypothetical protein
MNIESVLREDIFAKNVQKSAYGMSFTAEGLRHSALLRVKKIFLVAL